VIEAVLFDGDQTLWDFQKVMRTALLDVLDAIRAARPGAAADALRIADLQADRNAVAEGLLGVEFNLARLRRLGFTRSLERLRRDGSAWTESEDDALADALTATYFRSRDRDPALFTDTLPGLEALRSEYRIGLLSNGSRLPESIGLAGIGPGHLRGGRAAAPAGPVGLRPGRRSSPQRCGRGETVRLARHLDRSPGRRGLARAGIRRDTRRRDHFAGAVA
jgi:hypothetical protein